MNKDELLKLAERVEALDGPDRTVDCLIALATQGYSLFHSKHNYWTISKGRETVIWEWARHEDWSYDPHTGKRLGEPEEPLDWAWEANLPQWTESLDAAMSLVPEGFCYELHGGYTRAMNSALVGVEPSGGEMMCATAEGEGVTPAIAITAAALRAIAHRNNP